MNKKVLSVFLAISFIFSGILGVESKEFDFEQSQEIFIDGEVSSMPSEDFLDIDPSSSSFECDNKNPPDSIIVKIKAADQSQLKAKSLGLFSVLNNSSSANSESENIKIVEELLDNISVKDVKDIEPLFKKEEEIIQSAIQASSVSSNSIGTLNLNSNLKFQAIPDLSSKYGFDRVFTINLDLDDSKDKCAEIFSIIEELNKHPQVEYVEINKSLHINSIEDGNPDDTFFQSSGQFWSENFDELWGIKHIEADKVWQYSTGKDTVVAVVDTGVDYNHPDLWDNIWIDADILAAHLGSDPDLDQDGDVDLTDVDLIVGDLDFKIEPNEIIDGMFGYNFVDDNFDPIDDRGHGTHVAGTIAAVGNNSRGVIGVAPNAKILIVKGLNRFGQGYTNDLAAAIKYAADEGADISNHSWGGSGYSPTLESAINYAHELGTLNIAAAGNNYFPISSIHSPGTLSTLKNTVTVSALEKTNFSFRRPLYSSYGLETDLSAPGSDIVSTGYESYGPRIGDTSSEQENYQYLNGTSMAAPHVAGVAALLKSLDQSLTPDQIARILKSSPQSLNTVNALKAVENINLSTITAKIDTSSAIITDGFVNLFGDASSTDGSFNRFEIWAISNVYRQKLFTGYTPLSQTLLVPLNVSNLANDQYSIELRVYNNENQYVKDDVLFHVINNAPIAPTVINPEDPSYSDEQVSIFFDVLRTKDYGRFADYKKENITEFRLYRQEENEDSYTLVKTIDATDYNSLRMPCKTQISV